MPRLGLLCEVSGDLVSDEACRACARVRGQQRAPDGTEHHCQFNYPLIAALTAEDPDRARAGVSMTNLCGICMRKAVWERQRSYSQFPHQMLASLGGTAVHGHLEAFNEPEVIAEVRLAKTLPSGRQLTGKLDRYHPLQMRIEDYKRKDKPFEVPSRGYVAQLNGYRYFIETGCVVMDTGEVLTGLVQELVLYCSTHKGWKEVQVPLWSHQQTIDYLETALDEFSKAAEDPEYIAPPFADPNRQPFCTGGWCPFFVSCRQIPGRPWHPLDTV